IHSWYPRIESRTPEDRAHEFQCVQKETRCGDVFKKSLLVLALSVSALAVVPAAQGAGMTGQTITQQKIVGAYKLVLNIGPPETGMMMTGPKAMCSMSGMHLMREAAKTSACNHHAEVHVYGAKNGKVVTGLKVTIQFQGAKHMSMMVPVDGMETGKNFHYGNNVYITAGKYTVIVH